MGVLNTEWIATLSSTTPSDDPRCPPVCDTASITSARSSSATRRRSRSGIWRRSDGPATRSRSGVAGVSRVMAASSVVARYHPREGGLIGSGARDPRPRSGSVAVIRLAAHRGELRPVLDHVGALQGLLIPLVAGLARRLGGVGIDRAEAMLGQHAVERREIG